MHRTSLVAQEYGHVVIGAAITLPLLKKMPPVARRQR
jgi:hypothetical protein